MASAVSLSNALAIDRAGFAPLIAVRAALGVTVPFAVGVVVGHPAEGAIAAAGALPAGVAGIGAMRNRSDLLIGTTLGMAVSTFVGGLVAGHLAATLVALAFWAFGAGLMVVIGREATIIGVQAVVGLVVFGRFPSTVSSSAVHAGWVFAGGAFQALLALVIRPPRRFTAERRILAAAYADLSELSRQPNRSAISAQSEAAEAGRLLARHAPSSDIDLLRGIADEAERIRLELSALAALGHEELLGPLRDAVCERLADIARRLAYVEPSAADEAPLTDVIALMREQRDAAPAGRSGTPARYAYARAVAVEGQLRAVERLVSALAGVRRIALPHPAGSPSLTMLPRLMTDTFQRLATAVGQPSSSAFRHAVRLAVILPAAEWLSHGLPWQRGYWVTLTALVVLRPDYAATMQRGIARIIGTGLGVVVAGLLVEGLKPSGSWLAVLLLLATWAGYTTFAASYALYSFAVTAIVVLLLTPINGIGTGELSTVADRGLDTLIGGAMALAGYLIWPTWERESLYAGLSRLLSALARYADLVLSAYVDLAAADAAAMAAAATEARRARMAVQASFDRASAEPARVRPDLDQSAGVMSATRRIVIAVHALRATLDDTTEHESLPEVAPLREAVVTALRACAERKAADVEGLREMQQSLDRDYAGDPHSLHARRLALIAAHLDPLVDSIDTLAHVMTPRMPESAPAR
jgi:uncharacterized membrane protein YccC